MGASMQLISLWYIVAKFLRWSGIKTTNAFGLFRELSSITSEENENPRAGITCAMHSAESGRARSRAPLVFPAVHMQTTWRMEENPWLSEIFSGSQVSGNTEKPGTWLGHAEKNQELAQAQVLIRALVWDAPVLHLMLGAGELQRWSPGQAQSDSKD